MKQAGAYVTNSGPSPATNATTLRTRGGETTVLDGPFAETKEQLPVRGGGGQSRSGAGGGGGSRPACRRAFGPGSDPVVRQFLEARLDPKQPLPDRRGTGSDT